MSTQELLPCPFCGGTPYAGILDDGWGQSFVKCNGCGCHILGEYPCKVIGPLEPSAKLKWNTRTFYPIKDLKLEAKL